jgi:FAD/FMN-containing dehydrogenase
MKCRSILIAIHALTVLGACSSVVTRQAGFSLNDIHSQMNRTEVSSIERPSSVEEVQRIVKAAKAAGRAISISGGQHAMGGQQFGKDTVHVSMSAFDRILGLDANRGVVEVQAGVEWPELIQYLWDNQKGMQTPWGIIQKQTGADRLTIGGAISANIHGRGLTLQPFIWDR